MLNGEEFWEELNRLGEEEVLKRLGKGYGQDKARVVREWLRFREAQRHEAIVRTARRANLLSVLAIIVSVGSLIVSACR